jgi:hypothetical protein
VLTGQHSEPGVESRAYDASITGRTACVLPSAKAKS